MVLCRIFSPIPQLTLQLVHSPHGDTTQSVLDFFFLCLCFPLSFRFLLFKDLLECLELRKSLSLSSEAESSRPGLLKAAKFFFLRFFFLTVVSFDLISDNIVFFLPDFIGTNSIATSLLSSSPSWKYLYDSGLIAFSLLFFNYLYSRTFLK